MWTVLGAIAAILPLVGGFYFLRKIVKAIKAPVTDFSFGRKDIQATSLFIQNKKFTQAETMLSQFDSDDLTQAVDHIAISSTEKQLGTYYEKSNGGPLASLLLGAWHLHKAWKLRGHKKAAELKDKQFKGYVEHIKLAGPYLQKATEEAWLAAEAHSRLIRVDMGLGHLDSAEAHFKAAVKSDPGHLWAYLHYAECIQPKWGGSVEQVEHLLNTLPEDYLIRNTIRLKLMNDNFDCDTDFFGLADPGKDWNGFLSGTLTALDAEITANPPASIQRYVMYGYMYVLSLIAENGLSKKYKKLVGTNYTLYPFGYN